ncbi:MAG: hypothetical protein LUO81_03375 [Methanoregulaceae archaeon]|nr:hypothetical protein [Methanoregulaceae archaeon]
MKFNPIILLVLCAAIIGTGCVQDKGGHPTFETPTPSPEPSTISTTPAVSASPSFQPYETLGGPVMFISGGTYHVGDRLLMTGTTILSPGNQQLIEVSSVSFGPTNKTMENGIYGISAVITVEKGDKDSQNKWEYLLDTADFAPDEYQVLISGITVPTFRESASFLLLP